MRECICELAIDGFLVGIRYELLEALKCADDVGKDQYAVRGTRSRIRSRAVGTNVGRGCGG